MKTLALTLAVMGVSAALFAEPTVKDLNARYAAAGKGRITFKADEHGEPIVTLKDGNGTCSVMLRGGHVTACHFAGDRYPLLYVPKMGYKALPGPRDFIHGGVPLLWPWFGSSGAPEDPSWRRWLRKYGFPVKDESPFHATARYSLFDVSAIKVTSDETAVTLTLGPCEEVTEWTAGNFRLDYTITLGKHKLGLALKTTNLGEETFRYREGYHPYFAVANCYHVTLSGVDGCPYESNRPLINDTTYIWKGPVPEWPGCDLFKFKTPRSVVTLSDPDWKRDIILSTTGARDIVTWCQDVKGASKGTMNIKPEECSHYFCIEPSNFYPESEIALQKNEAHLFETIITVQPQSVFSGHSGK